MFTQIVTFLLLLFLLLFYANSLPLLLKIIGKQDSGKKIVKDISCCHGNQIFDAMFSETLPFFHIFSFN